MKVNWFHLMPYRWLPDDFREKYRSVWVDIPSSLWDSRKGHHLYNEYLDELEFAEQMGLDGICVNEHHSNGYGLMPSPNIMAACLARRTSRANLIVLGNSLALYNPPLRVAEEFAMLDCISGGRLVAGFPVGTSMDDNFAYGIVPATLRERHYEAHDLIIKAWTTPEPFAFNGRYTKVRYVNVWPRPLQQPHPPVWAPGGGSVETWDWVLKHDYAYCYLSYFGYQHGKKVMDGFWEKVAQVGAEPNPYRAGFLQLVLVAESDAQAEKEYAKHVDYFFNRCLRVYSGFSDAPGYRTEATIRAGFNAQVGAVADMFRYGLTWKEFLERGYIIAGSPATVRDRLLEAVKGLRIGQLMVLQQVGSMPKELVLKNTELFAREVMPAVKQLWANEWRDRWCPKPLADRAVPGAAVAN
ncbi:MAG TPA: LLM class flavin-dependent oxidoreductase [Methylomirabilota bacterium]|jgi:alkanesulfonate monooxygenase SsuD/methylene tetrahydromethanopterin reductase-like flavin-dependent oxidoreductase (luciferase family)|nr:LLM class flavin-dependent oxidoreductase [Methylomirabilota bacterium]